MKKKISFIIPCYNEEKNIDLISESIHLVMSKLNYFYEIIFINDGSRDRTFDVLHEKTLHRLPLQLVS
jgi:undecaprenyl-phosphate 4-deoxy-4-formamido-L-arabinose transferase